MLDRFKTIFASPEGGGPEPARWMRRSLFLLLTISMVSLVVAIGSSRTTGHTITLSILAATIILELTGLGLLANQYFGTVRVIVTTILVLAVTAFAVNMETSPGIWLLAYILPIVVAAIMNDGRALAVTTVLTVTSIASLAALGLSSFSPAPAGAEVRLGDAMMGTLLLIVTAAILGAGVNRFRAALAHAAAREQTQLAANEELHRQTRLLENRVDETNAAYNERGHQLEAAVHQINRQAAQFEALARVARTIAAVRDLQELLPRIASVISNSFGFYHVGLFLMDEANEYAVLTATNSEGGKKMLDRRHRLRVGQQGIVGHVTASGEARIVMDVGRDDVFFENPELPDTHSEMALPLKAENRIIGALDIQSTERDAFTDEDIRMLSLLADQVSLAIENARLFDETRKALAEAEAVGRQFVREAWGRVPVEHKLVGYRYNVAGAVPLTQPVDISDSRRSKTAGDQAELNQVVVPIELRGEIIGTMIVQSPSSEKLNREQIDLIKAVAERVALSAENARLFDETTRRAERERLVTDITGKIRSVNDPQSMIETAMEELRRALGASRVEVVPQVVKGADSSWTE